MSKKKSAVPVFMRNQYNSSSGGGSYDGARLPKNCEYTQPELITHVQYSRRKDGSTVASYFGRSEKY